mgnify:CR=1 FL=1
MFEDNQKLKDELNRLKGEKGKPEIKPNVPTRENTFAPDPTREKKEWDKKSKKDIIKIDKVVVVSVDKNIFPPDAVFKGHDEVIKHYIYNG